MPKKEEKPEDGAPDFSLCDVSLFLLFEFEGDGGFVANLGGTPVLDGAGINVAGLACPLLTGGSEGLEGCSVELHERLADHGLHLAVTFLHVHHHGDGHTTCNPLVGRSGCVLHDGHVAGLAVSDELGGTGTERVAVVGIEVGRSGAASLISEEVVLGGKLAYKLAILLPLVELGSHHVREQLLGFDERYLHVSVGGRGRVRAGVPRWWAGS